MIRGSAELTRVLELVEKDKGIDHKILIEAIEQAVLAAAKKQFGQDAPIEAHFNPDTGEVELFEFKQVMEVVTDPITQVAFSVAKAQDPEIQLGDSLGVKMDPEKMGRISAQTAKQIILQRMKEAEREIIYKEFKEREGEIVLGIVRRYEGGALIVDLGRTEGILPPREQIPREVYRVGDRLRAYVLDIHRGSRGPQILLSRTSPKFLMKLFQKEVPEIQEGTVQIKAAAWEPGVRAKIAVHSLDSDVDPVGACVGMKGSRVQAVVQELRGEKIDIVAWSPDPAKLVMNALAPAEASEVIVDEADHAMEVVVPDDQLSLAIGRKGQNVRLAVDLTGWKIDIKSDKKIREMAEEARRTFKPITEIGDKVAEFLIRYGFPTVQGVAEADLGLLAKVPGVGEVGAARIRNAARKWLEENPQPPAPPPTAEGAPPAPAESSAADPAGSGEPKAEG